MQNRWGVDVKKGHWVRYQLARGGMAEGKVSAIDRTSELARAYGPLVSLEGGGSCGLDDVALSMGPMVVSRSGVVSQNPTPNLMRADQDSQRPHVGKNGKPTKRATPRLKERRAVTHYEPLPGVWANPLVRVKVKSPPQRPRGSVAVPSERLKARRKTTQKAPDGFYANPVKSPGYLYCVWRMDANGQPAYFMRAERTLTAAKEYAQSLANKSGIQYGIVKKPL